MKGEGQMRLEQGIGAMCIALCSGVVTEVTHFEFSTLSMLLLMSLDPSTHNRCVTCVTCVTKPLKTCKLDVYFLKMKN